MLGYLRGLLCFLQVFQQNPVLQHVESKQGAMNNAAHKRWGAKMQSQCPIQQPCYYQDHS